VILEGEMKKEEIEDKKRRLIASQFG